MIIHDNPSSDFLSADMLWQKEPGSESLVVLYAVPCAMPVLVMNAATMLTPPSFTSFEIANHVRVYLRSFLCWVDDHSVDPSWYS